MDLYITQMHSTHKETNKPIMYELVWPSKKAAEEFIEFLAEDGKEHGYQPYETVKIKPIECIDAETVIDTKENIIKKMENLFMVYQNTDPDKIGNCPFNEYALNHWDDEEPNLNEVNPKDIL